MYIFQGISTMHLTPFEVLTAINHAQLRLNQTFKEEEFANGQVGKLMIAEDFDFEKTVSLTFYKLEFVLLPASLELRTRVHVSSNSKYNYYIFQSKVLSEDHKTHFEEEIRTLSGALKAQYDRANKEYEGNSKFSYFSATLLKYSNQRIVIL